MKKYSPKYINTFEDFPGLPVHYYIITMDGVYEYKLISIEEMLPSKDLFGVPSNYKRVTFNEFLDIMLQLQGGGEGEKKFSHTNTPMFKLLEFACVLTSFATYLRCRLS